MKMHKLLSLFLFSLALICAGNFTNVLAEDTPESDLDKSAATYNQKQKNNKNKVVCKKEARVGTRIKKKVCRTVATMEKEAEHGKRFLKRSRVSVGDQE